MNQVEGFQLWIQTHLTQKMRYQHACRMITFFLKMIILKHLIIQRKLQGVFIAQFLSNTTIGKRMKDMISFLQFSNVLERKNWSKRSIRHMSLLQIPTRKGKSNIIHLASLANVKILHSHGTTCRACRTTDSKQKYQGKIIIR